MAASGKALSARGRPPIAKYSWPWPAHHLNCPPNSFHDSFVTLGLTGNVMIESDLLAAFYSGTFHDDGIALIAGTGAVGARIAGRSALPRWPTEQAGCLGDEGSGFWLGREVARAVAAALDGRGQPLH